MGLEQNINYQLNKYPKIKKIIKRFYQLIMYSLSDKVKVVGDVHKLSPDDDQNEYFFGYYDKSPWDKEDRYVLCMRAKNTRSDVSPREKADILLIDTNKYASDPNRVKKIAETKSWNVQQGCMLQWLGPDFNRRIIYNDFRDGDYVSIILDIVTKKEKVISAPVYSVSSDGKFALTLDFSRLYNLRPGYGYYNKQEETEGINLPDDYAIWKINLETNEITGLLKYTDFSNFMPRKEMKDVNAIHKVNHIMINPSNDRFMVLYRWLKHDRKYSRLITCNVDGSEMFLLSDDDMVSHCFWRNDNEVIAFENKKDEGIGYYLMLDKTNKYTHCWKSLTEDGHPSFSPDGKYVVTDTYPDKKRMQSLKVMDGDSINDNVEIIAKVFSPFKYDNDTRCDLHPRRNHNSNKISFDSVFEGKRGLYYIDLRKNNN